MKLYDITQEYLTVLEMFDSDEVDEQAIKDTLESIEDEFETKAENYGKIIRNLEATILGIKEEEKRLADRKKSIEKKIDFLKMNLFEAMKKTGKTKFNTGLFNFSICKNGGKVPIVLNVDANDLPKKFSIVEKKPNMDALREYLETGLKLKYATLGERGEHLRIK